MFCSAKPLPFLPASPSDLLDPFVVARAAVEEHKSRYVSRLGRAQRKHPVHGQLVERVVVRGAQLIRDAVARHDQHQAIVAPACIDVVFQISSFFLEERPQPLSGPAQVGAIDGKHVETQLVFEQSSHVGAIMLDARQIWQESINGESTDGCHVSKILRTRTHNEMVTSYSANTRTTSCTCTNAKHPCSSATNHKYIFSHIVYLSHRHHMILIGCWNEQVCFAFEAVDEC